MRASEKRKINNAQNFIVFAVAWQKIDLNKLHLHKQLWCGGNTMLETISKRNRMEIHCDVARWHLSRIDSLALAMSVSSLFLISW